MWQFGQFLHIQAHIHSLHTAIIIYKIAYVSTHHTWSTFGLNILSCTSVRNYVWCVMYVFNGVLYTINQVCHNGSCTCPCICQNNGVIRWWEVLLWPQQFMGHTSSCVYVLYMSPSLLCPCLFCYLTKNSYIIIDELTFFIIHLMSKINALSARTN